MDLFYKKFAGIFIDFKKEKLLIDKVYTSAKVSPCSNI